MERDNPSGSGPYFTDETVDEYAAGQAIEQATGLAALDAWQDADRYVPPSEELVADTNRRRALIAPFEAEYEPLRVNSVDAIVEAAGYIIEGDSWNWRLRHQHLSSSKYTMADSTDFCRAKFPLDANETVAGVYRHRTTGAQVFLIERWTFQPGNTGSNQPEYSRVVPVIAPLGA